MGQTAAVHLNGNKFGRLSDKITSRRWGKKKNCVWLVDKRAENTASGGAVRRGGAKPERAAGCGRS